MKKIRRNDQSASIRQKAFTLIELLVVISIILIASGIILVGGNRGSGVALSSSQRIVSGIVQGAHGQAVLRGAKTRMIIHNDPNELDKYRRFFGIVYEGESASGAELWFAATQGTYLPKGIYFDREASSSHSGSRWPAPTMNLDYPRLSGQTAGGSTNYLYFEFEANGHSANPNSWLVLRSGSMRPDQSGERVGSILVDEAEQNLRSALILRLPGSTTPVNDPSAINQGINSTEIQ